LALATHRAIAHREVGAAAQRPDARLRDDVDERAARIGRFRGELIARDVDRLDLRLRRHLLPLEAVDAQHGVGAGQFGKLPLQFGRVVRQRTNLLVGQREAELRGAPIGGRFLRVAPDHHLVLEPG
jgi:hypothetical protein